jgi:hypothetical protein
MQAFSHAAFEKGGPARLILPRLAFAPRGVSARLAEFLERSLFISKIWAHLR